MKKKILLVGILTTALVGCGDEPEPIKEVGLTSQQKFEMEMQEKQFEHELEMQRLEIQQIKQEQQYVEPTPSGYIEEDPIYSEAPQRVYRETSPRQGRSEVVYEPEHEMGYSSDSSVDDGYSGGSVLASGAMGLASGYIAAKVLDDGWRSYTTSDGSVYYSDNSGRSVSAAQFQEHSKTHKIKKSYDKSKAKAKQLANKGIDKSKQLIDKTKPMAQKAGMKTKAGASKLKEKAKAAYAKASPKAKEQMRKGRDKAKAAWNKASPATKQKFRDVKEKYKKASPQVKKQMRVRAKQAVRKAKQTARKSGKRRR